MIFKVINIIGYQYLNIKGPVCKIVNLLVEIEGQ